jgi:hypothetical protein
MYANKKKVKEKNENGMGDWALSDYPAQNTYFFSNMLETCVPLY